MIFDVRMLRHLRTFSATSFQIIFNQVLGLAFFMMMALYLSKDVFGDLNWAVAVGYTLTVMLTFGFDHVTVRRIASGSDPYATAGTYLAHAFTLSMAALIVILGYRFFFPVFQSAHQLLFLVLAGSFFTYLSFPFRQLANGLEKFWHLAVMNVSGNVIRVGGMAIMILERSVDAANMGWLFLYAGIAELIIAVVLTQHFFRRPLLPVFRKRVYRLLIREALPTLGVILFESAFARVDWILMGILDSSAGIADYSFAYKAYDSSRIPLLIIAPVLLPRISRIYGKGTPDTRSVNELNKLWKIESLICVVIPMVLIVCWVDLVNLVTDGRYGQSTFWVYTILSLAMPMLYITNFFWTIAFARKRFRLTLRNAAITMLSNLCLNLVLIPLLGAVGAAIACTVSILIQMLLYVTASKEDKLDTDIFLFLKAVLLACIVIAAFHYLRFFWLLKGVLAVLIYLILAYFSGMLGFILPRKRNIS